MDYICVKKDRNIKKGTLVEILPPHDEKYPDLHTLCVDNTIRLFIAFRNIEEYYKPLYEIRNETITQILEDD